MIKYIYRKHPTNTTQKILFQSSSSEKKRIKECNEKPGFIFQAVACYLPKFIWDKFEGGLLRTIVMGLNIAICPEGEKTAKKGAILDYITKHIRVSVYEMIVG